nr:cysteine desulfurase family protein [uncultured Marinifilum sp.]
MSNSKSIYLDYAASTPVVEEVLSAIIPYFTTIYSNPSNEINAVGQTATNAVKKAQEQIKDLLNAWDYEIVFTSGATESINTALKSLFTLAGGKKNKIITCKTEHKAVLSVCEYLETIGAEIEYLPVDINGNISLENLKNIITKETLAVVLMSVNNEAGIIHDIDGISKICQEKSVRFLCDATQAVGKLPLNLTEIPVDYLIFSGHKIYAPKGVGVLLIRKDEKLIPLIHGGGQQANLRSGTLNVPGIVGVGKAAELLKGKIVSEFVRITKLQKEFEKGLLKTGKVSIISRDTNRSPYISNIHFLSNESEEIIFPLKDKLFFSTGSACTTQIIETSHVLREMGMKSEEAGNCLRFSFGISTTAEEINQALTLLKSIIE